MSLPHTAGDWIFTVLAGLGWAWDAAMWFFPLALIVLGLWWLVRLPFQLFRKPEPSFGEHFEALSWESWRKVQERELAEMEEGGEPMWKSVRRSGAP